MSDKYTKEDILAFERKDKLNARMSALKASATNCEGGGVSPESLIKAADEYYGWLVQDQTFKENTDVRVDSSLAGSSTGSTSHDSGPEVTHDIEAQYDKGVAKTVGPMLPIPTVAQAGWLEKIEKNYGYSKEQVYAVENKYPSNKDDATRIVRELKAQNQT